MAIATATCGILHVEHCRSFIDDGGAKGLLHWSDCDIAAIKERGLAYVESIGKGFDWISVFMTHLDPAITAKPTVVRLLVAMVTGAVVFWTVSISVMKSVGDVSISVRAETNAACSALARSQSSRISDQLLPRYLYKMRTVFAIVFATGAAIDTSHGRGNRTSLL